MLRSRRRFTGAITSSVPSGANAVSLETGQRIELGAGTNDYLVSNGTSVIVGSGISGHIIAEGFGLNGTVANNQGMMASGSDVIVNAGASFNIRFRSSGGVEWGNFGTGGLNLAGTAGNKITLAATDSTGTPGASTINKASGQVSIAAGASSVVVTNSLVTTTSVVFAVLQFADSTLNTLRSVVPGSGSFTITGNANATAATKVGFVVFN